MALRMEGFSEVSGLLKCGIYALVSKGQVIYIGKSKTLLSRIYTHRQNWIAKRRKGQVPAWLQTTKAIHFDEVHIRPCHPDEVDRLEREMIEIYRPRINTQLKPEGYSQLPLTVHIDGIAVVLNPAPAPKPDSGFHRRA